MTDCPTFLGNLDGKEPHRHSLRLRFKTGISMLVALAMVVNLIALSSAEAGVNTWTPIGPEGGTVTLIAVAPSDPQIIYALTSYDVLFSSVDGGGSWRFVSGGLSLTALVVDPGNPQTLYAIASNFPHTDPLSNNRLVAMCRISNLDRNSRVRRRPPKQHRITQSYAYGGDLLNSDSVSTPHGHVPQ
jgi:hypothetical protein